MIAEAVRDFAREAVLPAHESLDHGGVWPEALWTQIADLGLFGTFLPEDMGGAGAGFLAHGVAIETLARSAGVAGVLPAGQGIVIDALRRGPEEAASRWLGELAAGSAIGAPALAEAAPGAVACMAEGPGSEVALRGVKSLVPAPGRAGCYLVSAVRDGSVILAMVDAAAPGVVHAAGPPALGLHGYECGDLRLDGAPGLVLGGGELAEAVFTGARVAVSALLLGLGAGALDHALRYSAERKQFNLELRRFGAIQDRIARSDTRIEALRGLVRGAAARLDGGADASLSAMRARQFASEAAPAAADDAVQIYGGYGFSREYPVERFYRDSLFPGFGEYHRAGAIDRMTAMLE